MAQIKLRVNFSFTTYLSLDHDEDWVETLQMLDKTLI